MKTASSGDITSSRFLAKAPIGYLELATRIMIVEDNNKKLRGLVESLTSSVEMLATRVFPKEFPPLRSVQGGKDGR